VPVGALSSGVKRPGRQVDHSLTPTLQFAVSFSEC
jgi:hypothetical protein